MPFIILLQPATFLIFCSIFSSSFPSFSFIFLHLTSRDSRGISIDINNDDNEGDSCCRNKGELLAVHDAYDLGYVILTNNS